MSKHEQALAATMRQYGYRAEIDGQTVRLHSMPIGRWGMGYELPYRFRSISSAAEHLIPIIADDNYTQAVIG